MLNKHLIKKYNVPGPRYTSYPTVPYWDETAPTKEQWKEAVQATFSNTNAKEGISLYIHLPYCETLCTYCACNTRISINHAVEEPYCSSVLTEWQLYRQLFAETPRISEIHLGGGTPTFFSPENLQYLIQGILQSATLAENASLSFEAHPRNTTRAHLEALYSLGFRRLSLGIQDFDSEVQRIINRIQTFEQVEKVTRQARGIGYTSVNFDLIFGLPRQTAATIEKSFRLTNELRPDRIAYYSYAHVPWVKPGQRSFSEKDLPSGDEKRSLYELGKQLLEENGYKEIGMDHFTLPTDELYQAAENRTLHRNFMGYTEKHTSLLLGLGTSSISDTWTAFAQNAKTVEKYRAQVATGRLPIFKGHLLNEEDLFLRKQILNLMCHFETSWEEQSPFSYLMEESLIRLREMEEDGLVETKANSIKVREAGGAFARNIAMALDARLWRSKPATELFSGTV